MIKKVKLILVIIIFILSFICHFAYELIPNFIFSIIFPVNESIWEHMKLIATPVIIGSIFEYIYYKRKKINCNNFILSYGISIIFGIGFYLAMSANLFEGSIFIRVVSYIPLISAILSPSLLILGQIGIVDIIISIALMIVTIFVLIKYGLRIYKVGILNYSSSGLWKKMFKAL